MMVQTVTVICIREVLLTNLRWNTNYPVCALSFFSSELPEGFQDIFLNSPNRFLLNPSKFNFHYLAI
jgi:hypothetical protein